MTAKGMFVALGVVLERLAVYMCIFGLAGYYRDRQTMTFLPVQAVVCWLCSGCR